MILPDNGLKGVTKMMMGLFIIILLIQPLGHFFRFPSDIAGTLPALSPRQPAAISTGEIIRDGLGMREKWTARQIQTNQSVWKEKVRQMVGMIEGVNLIDLKLKFDSLYPQKICLRVRAADSEERTGRWRRETTVRLRNGIGLVTGLKNGQIEVDWDD